MPTGKTEMIVRVEVSSDHAAVRKINEAAFDSPDEANLVDALRLQADPHISLVAEDDNSVIGHIMFSPVLLPGHEGMRIMGLGPMAVERAKQTQGAGSALVRAGLEQCKTLGEACVVVLGHPEYYPRFGFEPASRFNLACEYDVPDEAFMAMELDVASLDDVAGTIQYHRAFAAL